MAAVAEAQREIEVSTVPTSSLVNAESKPDWRCYSVIRGLLDPATSELNDLKVVEHRHPLISPDSTIQTLDHHAVTTANGLP